MTDEEVKLAKNMVEDVLVGAEKLRDVLDAYPHLHWALNDIVLLADEVRRLREEVGCAGCGKVPAFCDLCGSDG